MRARRERKSFCAEFQRAVSSYVFPGLAHANGAVLALFLRKENPIAFQRKLRFGVETSRAA